jgi:hypothetical protein
MYIWWTRCVVTMSYLGHNVGNLDSEKGVHGKALPKTSAEAITDTRTLVAFRDQRGNGLTNSTGGNRQVRGIVVHTLEMALPAEEELKKKILARRIVMVTTSHYAASTRLGNIRHRGVSGLDAAPRILNTGSS